MFGVDRITGDLYAMGANSMTLISERATIVPQELLPRGLIPNTNPKCSVLPQWLTIV